MKNISIKVLCISLILLAYSTQKSFSQIDLSGHWTTHCVIEKTDKNKVSFCDFCKYSISGDSEDISFEIFEMIFDKDNLNIIIDSDSTIVDYKIKKDFNTLEFNYKEENYYFSILYVVEGTRSYFILKGRDGALMLLKRKE